MRYRRTPLAATLGLTLMVLAPSPGVAEEASHTEQAIDWIVDNNLMRWGRRKLREARRFGVDALHGDLHIPIHFLEFPLNYQNAERVAAGDAAVPPWVRQEFARADLGDDVLLRLYEEMNHSLNTLPPPFMVEGAFPDLLVGHWAVAREGVDGQGVLARDIKEVLIGELSVQNGAELIRSLHSMWLKALGHEDLAAFFSDGNARKDPGDPDRITADDLPPEHRSMVLLARRARARARYARAVPGLRAYSRGERAELLAASLSFDYLSRLTVIFTGAERMAHALTGAEAPTWLQDAAWFAAKCPLVGLTGRRLEKPGDPHYKARGQSLVYQLTPAGPDPLAGDLAWANVDGGADGEQGIPEIQRSVAALAGAIEARGEFVPAAVQQVVADFLAPGGPFDQWSPAEGYPRAHVSRAVRGLSAREEAIARLALQCITVPRRALRRGVDRYLAATGAGDRELLSVVAWASFQGSRKVCARLDSLLREAAAPQEVAPPRLASTGGLFGIP